MQKKKKQNIVLIGFMGVGKGRTARALAELTGRFAIDTDDLIESRIKMKIRSLFAEQGEPAFRKLERTVAGWLVENVQETVISTGGGFFAVPKIRKIGKVVYLHAEVESILATIQQHPDGAKKIKKRPLLADLEKAKELFAKRLPLYRSCAHLEIDVQGKSAEAVAEEICLQLGIQKRD
ncbi:shikimate kinase [Desulfogranum japonicum]|uniref:shikimate kinase n=1 Tax=Desulfogranum japonicum TaxID=231447 RepID=UPI0003F50CB6|nr:shikimate kinase [Desulfogranum japonicum]